MPRRPRVSITRRAGFLGTITALGGVLVVQACTDRTVVAVEIGSVAVQPPAASIVEGETLQFRAVVEDIGGRPLPRATVTWSTDPTDLLLVDSAGLGHALLPGAVQISATFRGVTGTADVTVLPAPHIELSQDTVIFYGAAGAQSPAAAVVQVSTGGGGAVGTLSTAVAFPSGGPSAWVTPVLAATATPTTLTLTPQTATLPVGVYTATVTVSSPEDDRSPVPLDVILSLTDVTVTESGGATSVVEAGGTDDFTVVLAAQPDSNVVIDVTTADAGEVVPSPARLTFTPADWDQPQTVTVTGQNERDADGDQTVDVTVAVVDTLSDAAYRPIPDRVVPVLVIDDDVAPDMTIVETPPGGGAGTLVNESGTTDQFNVRLNAPPISDVVLTVVSEDTTEVAVSPATLTFTTSDWSVEQTVTVTGVDDIEDDGDQSALVTISVVAALSDDAYDPVAPRTVNVTNVDNDAPSGLTVRVIGGTTVNETGTLTDDFTVELASEPASAVVVVVASQDTTEIALSRDTLTFTALDWNQPQVVTVIGVDDAVIDGTTTTDVVASVVDALSDDNFDGIVETLPWMTLDDDLPGLDVAEIGGGTTVTEGGTTDEITVALTAVPASNVVVAVSSGDTGEATVAPAALTFTPGDWNVAQTVTVAGVDDSLDDGDQNAGITFAVVDAQSDPAFSGISTSVVATVTDDDGVGFTVLEPGSTIVGEPAVADTFMVVLDAQPTSDVVLDVTSTNIAEAVVAPVTLTFTPSSWNTPQNVIVTGVNDDVDDGDQVTTVTIVVDNAASDPAFQNLTRQVLVTTTDDDAASFTVVQSGGSTSVPEDGSATDDFTVVLGAQPVTNVVVNITSTDIVEATVAPGSLTFTPGNWSTPQSVTVTGGDDQIDDGDQVTSVTVDINDGASDDTFDPIPAQAVLVTTTDDDAAGLTLATGATSVSESGSTATFTVVLDAQPVVNVVVDVTSSDAGATSVSPTTLTFTPVTWATPKTVTIRGVDDPVIDGPQPSTITVQVDTTASDPVFDGLVQTFGVTTTDDDVAGFTITEVGGTRVNEGVIPSQDDFTVVLDAQPSATVVFTVTSANTAEVTVDSATLTFTPATWNVAKTVTVTGVDDALDDGNQITLVTVASDNALTLDNAFDNLSSSVSVTTTDDDGVGFTITEIGSTSVPESGLFTDNFTVVLDAQPSSDVVFNVSSGDAGEAVVDFATLTFTPANWSTPQTVTVSGVDDDLIDGSQQTTISVDVDSGLSDPAFSGLTGAIIATTTDDDVAGYTLSGTAGLSTTEGGAGDSFTVALDAQPLTNVVLTVTSLDPAELSATPPSLTFTNGNWNTPQAVTVTAVNDTIVDGPQTADVRIQVNAGASDNAFDFVPAQTVPVATVDDDVAGLVVLETGGSTQVGEGGSTDVVTVRLGARPNLPVTLLVASADPTEATVDPAAITFTPSTWNTPRTVTVTGADDVIVDGTQQSLITIDVDDGNSDDAFDGLSQSVSVTTTDDDVASYVLAGTGALSVTEAGSSISFTAVLGRAPVTDVVLSATSGDPGEVTVTPATRTFTPLDWNTPKQFTLTGVDDIVDDGDVPTQITVAVVDALSNDAFDQLANQTANVTTLDDDQAGLSLADTVGLTVSESGTTATFDIVLTTQPVSNVVLNVGSSDGGEVAASPSTITFTPGSWDLPRTVTLSGVDDALIDGQQMSTITLAVANALSDDAFDGLSVQTSVTTADDDGASLVVIELGGTRVTESGSQDDFDVLLSAQPSSNVVLNVVSTGVDEAVVDSATLTFTPATWNVAKTVTVTGVDDAVDDGDQVTPVTITVNPAASDDAFDGRADTVRVTTTDDDGVGFTLTEASGTQVSESGTSDQVFVQLTSQPSSDVVLNVVSTDVGEATVDVSSLTFTSGNWSSPQQITVTGVDDAFVDGAQTTPIVVDVNDGVSDQTFALQVPPDTVLAVTLDNDTPGFLLTQSAGTTVVTEGGATDTVSVVLTARPLGSVRITVANGDPNQVSVSPPAFIFDSLSWQTPQRVVVTAANLAFVDGPASLTLTFSVDETQTDNAWDFLPDEPVTVTALDNDVAELVITESSGSTIAVEGGVPDSIGVSLGAGRPFTDVVLAVSSADPTEASIAPSSLTFTTANWQTVQWIVVTAQDDPFVDGPQSTSIQIAVNPASSDDAFDGVAPETLSATTNDNDVAEVLLTHTAGNTTVSENGTTDQVRVVLGVGQPLTDVVIDLSSGNTDEATVTPSSLTFSPTNWATPQFVTVTGIDNDDVVDGAQTTPITASVNDASSDDAWDPVVDQALDAVTTDNDVPDFSIIGVNITVAEDLTRDSFQVVLTAQPRTTDVVVLDIASDITEVEVLNSPATLTFNNADWDQPQWVILQGVPDGVPDTDEVVPVVISINLAGTATLWDGVAPDSIPVTNENR